MIPRELIDTVQVPGGGEMQIKLSAVFTECMLLTGAR